jgi:DNA-binding NtrC family response regulator
MKKTVIAIFEDDEVNRFIYARLFHLHQGEVDVHIFGNPNQGYAAAKVIEFNVVFIEVHFWKNYGGIDILTKLKEVSAPGMIAVAMTALLQQGDLENIMSAGFSMCLEKPVAFTPFIPRASIEANHL